MSTITILTIKTFTLLFILLNSIPFINSKSSSSKQPKKDMNPKVTFLHFYFHDIVSGRNRTAFSIVAPPANSPGKGFGSMVMIDDPLTEGPKLSSKLLGRAQGIYGPSDLETFGLLMIMNYVFTEESGYEGSTLSLMGRNEVLSDVREMSIVGGTGVFRLANGYAQAKTFELKKNGDAIVEYNVTVVQYI